MEQIPKEVIEMAEDFFGYMSNEEHINLINEYSAKQVKLEIFFTESLKVIDDKNVIAKCVKLYLIIYRCYQYYDINLPQIGADIVTEEMDKFMNRYDKRFGTKTTDKELCNEMKELTNQNELVDYACLKIFGTDENPVKYNNPKLW